MPFNDPFNYDFDTPSIHKGGDHDEDIPDNAQRFGGRGVRFGHDRPGSAGSHGESNDDWPVTPLPVTKG